MSGVLAATVAAISLIAPARGAAGRGVRRWARRVLRHRCRVCSPAHHGHPAPNGPTTGIATPCACPARCGGCGCSPTPTPACASRGIPPGAGRPPSRATASGATASSPGRRPGACTSSSSTSTARIASRSPPSTPAGASAGPAGRCGSPYASAGAGNGRRPSSAKRPRRARPAQRLRSQRSGRHALVGAGHPRLGADHRLSRLPRRRAARPDLAGLDAPHPPLLAAHLPPRGRSRRRQPPRKRAHAGTLPSPPPTPRPGSRADLRRRVTDTSATLSWQAGAANGARLVGYLLFEDGVPEGVVAARSRRSRSPLSATTPSPCARWTPTAI